MATLQIGPWEAIVAAATFLSPNILAFIQQPKWPLWRRRVALVMYHLSIATIYLGSTGKLDLSNLTVTFVTLITLGFSSYLGIWKPFADKLEIKTTKAMFGDSAVNFPKSLTNNITTQDPMANSRVGNEY